MLLSFVVVFLVVGISGTGINFIAILYLPIIMVVEYILALGMAMIFSALTVYFRDLEHILGIVTMAWQFLTPIMYSIEIVPESMMPVFMANPMTPIIIAYRDILYYKQIPHISTLLHAFVLGIVILILGSVVFNQLQKRFAEEL